MYLFFSGVQTLHPFLEKMMPASRNKPIILIRENNEDFFLT